MRIQVDARALREERHYTEQQGKKIVIACKRRLREVSFSVERSIKQHGEAYSMPRRTGRAAASWGHWTPGLLRPDAKDANPGDAVWEEKDDGLTIVQGSNVPYIEQLNAGHSKQQAAGFLDRAEEHGMQKLDGYIDEIMREF